MRDVVAWRCVRLSGADSEDVYIAALDTAFDGGPLMVEEASRSLRVSVAIVARSWVETQVGAPITPRAALRFRPER